MSRVKLLALSLVLVAIMTLAFVQSAAAAGSCTLYNSGAWCSAGPGGTCCYFSGHVLLRCECNPYGYCYWAGPAGPC